MFEEENDDLQMCDQEDATIDGDKKEELGYELRSTPGKGVGVYATRNFSRNSVVVIGNPVKTAEKNTAWTTQVGVDRFILRGGLSSKVNHSCSPNVGYRDNANGGMDYVAFRDIRSGEEIVTDYAMGNHVIEHMPECLCGASRCRETITGWKDLPDEVKREYAGFHAEYLTVMDANMDEQLN